MTDDLPPDDRRRCLKWHIRRVGMEHVFSVASGGGSSAA